MSYPAFPIFEVLSYETGLPVMIVVWHVRSVRPIREKSVDDENVSRLEFLNGDVLDCSDSVEIIVGKMEAALRPVTDWLAESGRRV